MHHGLQVDYQNDYHGVESWLRHGRDVLMLYGFMFYQPSTAVLDGHVVAVIGHKID